MKKNFYLFFTLIFFFKIFSIYGEVYFEKQLDTYSPINLYFPKFIPKEALMFKKDSTTNVRMAIVKTDSLFVSSNKFDKSDRSDLTTQYQFVFTKNFQEIGRIKYFQYFKEDLKESNKNISAEDYTFTQVIRFLCSVYLSSNNLDKLIETNISQSQDFCLNPKEYNQLPDEKTIFYAIISRDVSNNYLGKKILYKGEWAYGNILINVESTDLSWVKSIGSEAAKQLAEGKAEINQQTKEKEQELKALPFFDRPLYDYKPSIIPKKIEDNLYMRQFDKNYPLPQEKSEIITSSDKTYYNFVKFHFVIEHQEYHADFYRFENKEDPSLIKKDSHQDSVKFIGQIKAYRFVLQNLYLALCNNKNLLHWNTNIDQNVVNEMKKCNVEPSRMYYFMIRNKFGIPEYAYFEYETNYESKVIFSYGNLFVSLLGRSKNLSFLRSIQNEILNNIRLAITH